MSAKTRAIVIPKLSRVETVRHCPSTDGDTVGVYAINILDRTGPEQEITLIFHLEALIQLQQRINAALQHMITH